MTPVPEQRQRPTRHVIVSVVELRRRLGERMGIDVDVILAPLAVVTSGIVESSPVVGHLTIESIERGVSVTGSVDVEWVGECRRCLEPVGGIVMSTIDEIFQVNAPDDSDINDFDGEQVDLLPLVRDAALVALPLAALCREDCAGPDPDRYPAVTAEEWESSRGPGVEADPRWAGLSDLELD